MNKISKTQELIFKLLADPSADYKIKKHLIEGCDTHTINKICEFVLNVLNKNIPITEANYLKLKPYAKHCRKILDKKLYLKAKKKI